MLAGSRDLCLGYMRARGETSPRLPMRVVRTDGRLVDEVPGNMEVSVGQVAGYPTAEQYEAAGLRAFENAAAMRRRERQSSTAPAPAMPPWLTVLREYAGKDGHREWASVSTWLRPGQALAVVDLDVLAAMQSKPNGAP